MRKVYTWEVRARNTPLLKRKCNHCDSDKYYCSEKFRMNAQKRNIDIWLIYRCLNCDNTFNMSIFSRTKTESINKNLFNKFSGNKTEVAWKYAFSREISRKNKVELDFSSVEFDIQFEYISMEAIINFDSEIVKFKIKYPFDFNLKLSSVIRKCFKLSANKLENLINAKVISVRDLPLQKKHKVKNEDIIKVNRAKLRCMYYLWLSQ